MTRPWPVKADARPRRLRKCLERSTTSRSASLMALPLPPCEGGREPKANGGFGFAKTKPPARENQARFPPSQGGKCGSHAGSCGVQPAAQLVAGRDLGERRLEIRAAAAHRVGDAIAAP